jgi:hypothetical protein
MAAVTSAVIGIGMSAYSAQQSFSNAAKQKQAASEADAAAQKAMKEAKEKAEIDHFEGLSVPLDAYEAEFENNLAVAQQNTEALQEGDSRALAAGVGRVGAVSGANAENTRIAMGEEISDMNMMKAESKDAINQQLIEMDVANAKENNQRKADADLAYSQSISQGIQAVGGGLQSAASLAPLYGKSKADRRGGKIAEQYASQKPEGMTDRQWQAKMGDQNFSKSQFKNLKNAEDGRARWNKKDETFDFQSDLGMEYMNRNR